MKTLKILILSLIITTANAEKMVLTNKSNYNLEIKIGKTEFRKIWKDDDGWGVHWTESNDLEEVAKHHSTLTLNVDETKEIEINDQNKIIEIKDKYKNFESEYFKITPGNYLIKQIKIPFSTSWEKHSFPVLTNQQGFVIKDLIYINPEYWKKPQAIILHLATKEEKIAFYTKFLRSNINMQHIPDKVN